MPATPDVISPHESSAGPASRRLRRRPGGPNSPDPHSPTSAGVSSSPSAPTPRPSLDVHPVCSTLTLTSTTLPHKPPNLLTQTRLLRYTSKKTALEMSPRKFDSTNRRVKCAPNIFTPHHQSRGQNSIGIRTQTPIPHPLGNSAVQFSGFLSKRSFQLTTFRGGGGACWNLETNPYSKQTQGCRSQKFKIF